MDGAVPIPGAIKAEAAAWLARLRADDRSPADDRAFRQWLAASPAHAAAFEAVNTVWDSAGALPQDLRGYREKKPSPVGRRGVLAGLGALFVMGSGAAFLRSAQAVVYQTDVGEQKHIVLDDNSQVFLDTDTRLVVNFSAARRTVDLQHGCANLRVMPDSWRPFLVRAAGARIITSHSNLDIRCDGGRMSALLLQGHATIETAGRGAQHPIQLDAGERLLLSTTGHVKLDRPDLAPLLAWQTGQAIFQNERLIDVIAEMNRYSRIKLAIADPAIGNLRMSGVYAVGDNVSFANSVAKLLPVNVHQSEDGIDLAADESRPSRD